MTEPCPRGSVVSGDIDPRHGAVVRITVDNPPFVKQDPNLSGQLGIGVPKPVTGLGILDTGASMSCIDASFASQLGLIEVDAIEMRGVQAAHEEDAQGHTRVRFGVIRIEGIARNFPTRMCEIRPLGDHDGEPLIVLVGRDILRHATLTWEGERQRFHLGFSEARLSTS